MICTHYSSSKIEQINSIVFNPKLKRYDKPQGLWITIDGEDDWVDWCLAESFNLDRLKYKHFLEIDEIDLLILDSPIKIREFNREFGIKGTYEKAISWESVYENYGGILISPYQWSLRLDHSVFWYYSWDCASGCIWNTESIKIISIEETQFKEREEVA